MMPTTKAQSTYPDCPLVARAVRIGGIGKRELLALLQNSGIELNKVGRELFAHERFAVYETPLIVETVEITVANLGFAQGAAMAKISERAVQLGLSLCPLELGPYLRLQYLDQPEGHIGHPLAQHRAPPGALTIASHQITEDDDIPKGFSLRRINGQLWLRGSRAAPGHVWSPEDHLAFAVSRNAA
jgi:hypothetical protein